MKTIRVLDVHKGIILMSIIKTEGSKVIQEF